MLGTGVQARGSEGAEGVHVDARMRTRTMKNMMVRHAVIALIATSVVACLAGPGHAQFVLYDDFGSGVIDPVKWNSSSAEGSFNGIAAKIT